MFRTIIYLFVFYANVSAWILLRIRCCSYNQLNNEYEHCRCSQSVKGSNPVCNSHFGFLAVRIISRSIDRWQLALQNDEDRNDGWFTTKNHWYAIKNGAANARISISKYKSAISILQAADVVFCELCAARFHRCSGNIMRVCILSCPNVYIFIYSKIFYE